MLSLQPGTGCLGTEQTLHWPTAAESEQARQRHWGEVSLQAGPCLQAALNFGHSHSRHSLLWFKLVPGLSKRNSHSNCQLVCTRVLVFHAVTLAPNLRLKT